MIFEDTFAPLADFKRASARLFPDIGAALAATDDAAPDPLPRATDSPRRDGLQELLALIEGGLALVAVPLASKARLNCSFPQYFEGGFALVAVPFAPEARLIW